MSDAPHCFKCQEEITFDKNRRGKNGKQIPLDPETNEPHRCSEDNVFTGMEGETKKAEVKSAIRNTDVPKWLEEKIDVINSNQQRLDLKFNKTNGLLEALLVKLGLTNTGKELLEETNQKGMDAVVEGEQ